MYIIGGKFKKKSLAVPKTDTVRPTTAQLREAVFNICQNYIVGARFLDLYAGSGAMGLEALSRGALSATFVENNRFALQAIKKNIDFLQVKSQTEIYPIAVINTLHRLSDLKEEFEIIYADPPYGANSGALILDFLDTYSLLTKNGSLFIEDASLKEPSLKNLKLYGERKLGRAHLYEYRFNARDI